MPLSVTSQSRPRSPMVKHMLQTPVAAVSNGPKPLARLNSLMRSTSTIMCEFISLSAWLNTLPSQAQLQPRLSIWNPKSFGNPKSQEITFRAGSCLISTGSSSFCSQGECHAGLASTDPRFTKAAFCRSCARAVNFTSGFSQDARRIQGLPGKDIFWEGLTDFGTSPQDQDATRPS